MGVLIIDLDAIVANWHVLRRQVSKNVHVAAVIKANAYGLGAGRIGPALYNAGCRHFFFAHQDEAIAAREYIALDACCYVLHGVMSGSEALFLQYNLVPVLSSASAIERWSSWRHQAGIAESQLPCVVKVDTGMTRLGLSLSELAKLCKSDTTLARANPVMFMSHLACSDEPLHPQNKMQLNAFEKASELICGKFPNIKLSFANSGGIFLGEKYHYNLVRPGAALYGIHPTIEMSSPMLPVVSLALPIIQLREVSGSASIGYGAKGKAKKGQVLAVVSGGYADGLHRVLGELGTGLCCGVNVPVVGRISMDAVTFDVTGIPDIQKYLHLDARKLPFSIEVINAELNLSAIAIRNKSLGYEVLSSLSAGRYTRRYLPLAHDVNTGD